MQPARRQYRSGDVAEEVLEIRRRLRALGLLEGGVNSASTRTGPDDTVYDDVCERAVRAFQQSRGLMTDGVCGPQTWRALRGSRFTLGVRSVSYQPAAMLYGDDVQSLQERLLELGYAAGRADGIFGAATDAAVRSFQRDSGLRPDGVCGPDTNRALRQLGRKVTGGSPQMLREAEALRRSGPSLRDKRIMIDPGHGGPNVGAHFADLNERDIVWDVAVAVSDLLLDTGAQPLLTRVQEDDPQEYERAYRCNAAEADLVISLHVDRSSSESASGAAGFHYGTETGTSGTIGERLAGMLARELSNRLGIPYLRTHPRTWDLLRLTAMPAVRLELGYITNDTDRVLLADATARRTIAEAIVIGIQRLFLPPERDHLTGTLDVSELRRSL